MNDVQTEYVGVRVACRKGSKICLSGARHGGGGDGEEVCVFYLRAVLYSGC